MSGVLGQGTNTPPDELAADFRDARLRARLSQVDLARLAGVPQASISTVESGTAGIVAMRKVAAALGYDIRLVPAKGKR